MATLVARGTTQTTTGTTWASLTNAVDGTAGTNGVTYATMTSTTSGAVATITLADFGFSSTIGSADTLNSISIALRHFENNTGRFAPVTFRAFDGATALGASATTCTLATAARTDTATPTVTLAQLRSSTFKIVVTVTGAASTQSRVFSIDQVDVTADYTPLPPAITQAAYRFYADGTETGSTALAAQDTGYTADTSSGDVNLQVRLRLQSTSAVTVGATDDFQLQWEKNTSGTWTSVALAEPFVDRYLGAENAGGVLGTAGQLRRGQSFLGNGMTLRRVGFKLNKTGAPATVDVVAVLYAHTGTFGSSGLPTGTALATSTTVLSSASLTTTYTWYYFDFAGAFTLTNGTPYFIVLECSGITGLSADSLGMRSDGISPTHAGNWAIYSSTVPSWSFTLANDLIFVVYSELPTTPTVVGYDSANLTDAAATTNRLGAGSGSFVAGEISETGLVTDLGWTANNHTELLYSITLKQADLSPTDTLRFRVLRNAATTGLTYTQTPTITIGAGAPTDRTGTATGAVTLSGSSTGQKDVTGVATGALALTGAAAGSAAAAPVLGTATGALAVTGTSAGTRGTPGVATGALTLSGVSVGTVTVTATATGTLTVSGVSAGQVTVTATATGALALSGTSTGTRGTPATATGALTVTGAASGSGVTSPPVPGTASGTITVSGTAAGVRQMAGVATGSVTLAGTASGTKNVTATATGALAVAGTATGTHGVTGTAVGSVTVSSLALGLVEGNAVGTAVGALTVQGFATGTRATTGVATGYLAIAGTAVGGRVAAVIEGEWNNQQVIAMQWGTEEVVDWFMLIPTATATGTVTLGGVAVGTVTSPPAGVFFKTALGTQVATTSGSTLVITTTADIAVDDLVVIRVASDNLSATTPTFICADSAGNTYTVHSQGAVNATAALGVAGAIICTKASNPISTGGTITVTLSGAVTARAVYAESFTGATNTTRSTPVFTTALAGAVAPGPTGTVNAGDLVLSFCVHEHNLIASISGDIDTLNGPWSTVFIHVNAAGGTANTRVAISGQHKIPTAGGAQTWTASGPSVDCLGGVVVLQAT